jgi:sugar phosphate isomerase/epimerase
MAYPKLSISTASTYHATFEQDVAGYAKAGIEGIGLWEYKLANGQDPRSIDAIQKAGLTTTICVPKVPCPLPDPMFAEPRDPKARVEELCNAIRRFAKFKPVGVMVFPGAPGNDRAENRRIAVDGLRQAAKVAEEVGVTLGLETLRKSAGSLATTFEETMDMIEDIGAKNMKVIYDTWHFWDAPNMFEVLRNHKDRFMGIQINDWPHGMRGWCDRKLPGDGMMELPEIFATLEAAGYDGWYDVEIFSDDGTFGNAFPDSLWKLSAEEFGKRSVKSFHAVWDKRKLPPPLPPRRK